MMIIVATINAILLIALLTLIYLNDERLQPVQDALILILLIGIVGVLVLSII